MLSDTQKIIWEGVLRALRPTDYHLLRNVEKEEQIGQFGDGGAFRLEAVNGDGPKKVRLTITFFKEAGTDVRQLMDYASVIFGQGAVAKAGTEHMPTRITYEK